MLKTLMAMFVATTTLSNVATADVSHCGHEHSRFNPASLSEYQECWLDVYKADETHGVLGSLFWVKVGGEYYSTTLSYLRSYGAEAWLEEVNADLVVSNLDNAIATTEDRIDAVVEIMIEDTTRINELTAEIKDLKTDLSLMTEMRDALETDNMELAIDLAVEMQAHMTTKSNHAQELIDLNDAHNDAIAEAQANHSAAISAITASHEMDLAAAIAEGNKNVAIAQATAQETIESMMNAHADALKAAQADLQSTVAELNAQHAEKVAELNKKIFDLIESNNAKQATINGMVTKAQYEALSADYQNLFNDLQTANVVIFDLEQDLKVANGTIASKQAIIDNLNAVIDQKDTIITSLQEKVEYWKAEYEKQKANALFHYNEYQHVKGLFEDALAAYHAELANVETLETTVAELTDDINDLNKDVADLNNDITDLNKTIAAKDAEISNLETEILLKQEVIDSMTTASAAKTKEINALKAEIEGLKQDKLEYWNYIYGIMQDAMNAKATAEYQAGNGMNDNSGSAIDADYDGTLELNGNTMEASLSNVLAIEGVEALLGDIEDAIEEAYDTGYDDGYTDGYADGFKDGVDSVDPM